MYTLKLKKSAPPLQAPYARTGRLVRTPQGQRWTVGSLATAQRIARELAGEGQLS